jgi:NADH:ubiquinone oxidoreductase subunit E
MKIQVCVGSSCHLKGSYEIIQLLKEKVNNGLEDLIDLSANRGYTESK